MSSQTEHQCVPGEELHDAAAVRRALGQAAHDLNNTIGALANFAEFLAEDLDPADPRRADAERIHALAQETIAYLKNMLAVAGRDFLRPERVELAPFLERFVEDARDGHGAQITLHVDNTIPGCVVHIDAARLCDTLDALVANAVQASDRPHHITIGLAADRDHEGCVAIEVRDGGRGFPADVLRDPFAPLTRSADGHRRWSLAKAAGFITQSGGDIRIDSQEGAGATVSIRLPFAPE